MDISANRFIFETLNRIHWKLLPFHKCDICLDTGFLYGDTQSNQICININCEAMQRESMKLADRFSEHLKKKFKG